MDNQVKYAVGGIAAALAAAAALMLSPTTSSQAIDCGGLVDTKDITQGPTVDYQFLYDGILWTEQMTFYRPPPASMTGACPIIVHAPGGCGNAEDAFWMGPQLSSRGYITVVLGVNCADKTQSVGNENQICCASALQAATDAVQTADNPYLSDSLTDRIGWSGYSAGSRAMINSHDDPGYGDPVNGPVRAIAGLDNIAIEQNGDDGSPFCGNIPQEPYATPTVPAMGLASGLTCNDGRPRTAKLTAWNHWRDAGVETMLLTFKNAGHGSFSGRGSTDSFKRSLSYYQGLWFDRWLKDDTDATAKLVNRDMLTVITNPASGASDDLLDPNWDSGVFMDGYDCATFQTSCTAP